MDSASKHVSGSAVYIDDMPEERNILHLAFGKSAIAKGKIKHVNLDPVRAAPGGCLVLSAEDIPGVNDVSPIFGDDPLFAEDQVLFLGQALFVVAASTRDLALRAASLAIIEYEAAQPLLSFDQAAAAEETLEDTQVMAKGDAVGALEKSANRRTGEFLIGGQDHFYLEGQICHAVADEDGGIVAYSSTQNPSEVQEIIARVLGLPNHAVKVEVRRMGGGFGGKETQPALLAAAASLVAARSGRPARLRMDRDDDMIMTGKRHDFRARYEVGFEDDGTLQALDVTLESRCGCSADLSIAVNDRAMFHMDNAYFIPHVRHYVTPLSHEHRIAHRL